MFRRLRSLRHDDGKMLGGVCEEGAKDYRASGCILSKHVTTATEFSDLQFSARHHDSNTYVMLLRSLLTRDHGSVFTHGDVNRYIVSGIIDWEDSRFYPAYYECTALTRTRSLVDEDDWYLYLPPSISPSEFPIRWLADLG